VTAPEGAGDYPTPRPGAVPTCPHCWNHDGRAGPANNTHGRFFCPCGTLFSGGRREWEAWRAAREQLRARAAANRVVLIERGYDFDHSPTRDRVAP
jgi:hypothetical protein